MSPCGLVGYALLLGVIHKFHAKRILYTYYNIFSAKLTHTFKAHFELPSQSPAKELAILK